MSSIHWYNYFNNNFRGTLPLSRKVPNVWFNVAAACKKFVLAGAEQFETFFSPMFID
jgi:hypothetical protein